MSICGLVLFVKHVCLDLILFSEEFLFFQIEYLAQRIYWSFDNTLQDLYNNSNGYSNNSIVYVSPDYSGSGFCVWLNRIAMLTPPILNMMNISFTYQMWIYPQS